MNFYEIIEKLSNFKGRKWKLFGICSITIGIKIIMTIVVTIGVDAQELPTNVNIAEGPAFRVLFPLFKHGHIQCDH